MLTFREMTAPWTADPVSEGRTFTLLALALGFLLGGGFGLWFGRGFFDVRFYGPVTGL